VALKKLVTGSCLVRARVRVRVRVRVRG